MSLEIQPWFLDFVQRIRCVEHRAPVAGHLSITVVNPVGYIGEARCQEGSDLVAVGLRVYRPLDPIELSDQALEVWKRVAPPMPCRECHQYEMKEFLIAVTGNRLRRGQVRSRCENCDKVYELPMFWTSHLAPIDLNEAIDLQEKIKKTHFVSDLLH